jgi:hypothetical protein
MKKIQYNGNQFTVTLPRELIEIVKWKKGTKIYIGKNLDSDTLYIEKISGGKK